MHPLFLRFFDIAARWKRGSSSLTSGSKSNSNKSSFQSSTRSNDGHAVAESLFIDAARELANELRAASVTDLGLLFDTPFKANTIMTSKKHQGMWTAIRKKKKTKSYSSFESATTLEQQPEDDVMYADATFTKEDLTEWHQKRRRRLSSDQILSAIRKPRQQREQASSDDRYMFFVRAIDKKEHLRLLSHGFRFGDPLFISKVMSNQLQVPSDYMANAFDDMLQYARAVDRFMEPIPTTGSLSNIHSNSETTQSDGRSSADMTSRVFVGLHVLVRETPHESLDQMQLLTDRMRRHAFPMVQLQYDDGRFADTLTRQERAQVQRLQGQSLVAMAGLPRDSLNSSTTAARFSTSTTLVGSSSSTSAPGSPVSPVSPLETSNAKQHGRSNSNTTADMQQRFMKAMEAAAQELARHYSAYITIPLASAAKLNGRVVDVPPFGITPGPSQLILYCACVTMPGLPSAMNQTTAERLKCQPLSIYRTLAYQITDDAAARHHTQQRLYSQRRFPAQPQSPRNELSQDGAAANPENQTAGSRLSVLSLPPPPRTKRRRPAGPLSLFTEIIPSPPTSPTSPSPQDMEMTIPTAYSTVLPARDRFWWLDGIMEETAHDAD